MTSQQDELASLLLAIEAELRRIDLWSPRPPSAAALASTAPFCIDTLSLPEWLQFVLIPGMGLMLEQNAPLPAACAITPIAEECFTELPVETKEILSLLRRFDNILNTGNAYPHH